MHLLIFVADPPGPKVARAIYDLYAARWGDRIRSYGSTAFGALLLNWTPAAQHAFEADLIPKLRQFDDWGYVLTDGQPSGSWIFMFHGYRPVSEAGKASFFRVEFDWQFDAAELLRFATDILSHIECVSGYGGYVLQGRFRGPNGNAAYDQAYAWARRYWAVQVYNLDVAVDHALDGYFSPNWLTIIGDRLAQRSPEALRAAEAAAYRAFTTPGGVILQAAPVPTLGDRHRRETLDGYEHIAKALMPIQVPHHGPFGGTRWTEDATLAWVRRFTDPSGFV
jgi:hypothetical protein